MSVRSYLRAFNGGEVSPEFFGRLDDAKYQAGLALCRNFVVLPHGPVENRAGTQFVRAAKKEDKRVRLLPFTYSSEQTMVLEFGDGYFRFHTQGGTVLSGTAPYELAHPYTEAQLFEVGFVQSADVVTLVHPQHPPRELRRLGPTNWQLVQINFASTVPVPTGVSATPTGTPSNPRIYGYVVTAVAGADESSASSLATCSNNLDEANTSNLIAWAAVPGAEAYRVYRYEAGAHAFIGQTIDLSLTDEGITPDVSITPPLPKNPFVGAGNYPSAVTYFEQRRVFAATLNAPQTLWMTRSGTESNMNTSFPVRNDDAVSFRIAAREANTIRHLVPLQDLMAMTQSAEWRVAEDITPTNLRVKPQSFVGASKVPPLVVNSTMVFPVARGGHVRALGFSNDAGGYTTDDLSLRAAHLFDGLQIVDGAQSKAPVPICWFVSSSGELLGLTFVPEQNIAAWHRHRTRNGAFESITVVAEGDEDVLYAVVRRQINGQTRRYIERLHSRQVLRDDAADGFFVDAGVSRQGAPISSISDGLGHLEGQEVAILVDGAVQPPQVVTSGSVSWPKAGERVVVGLPIDAELETLPFAFEMQGFAQGRPKNVLEVWFRLFRSRGVFAGPNADSLYEVKPRYNETPGSPPDLRSEEVSLKVQPTWGRDGTLYVKHDQPLPLTLLSLTLEVSVAG